MTTQNGIKRYSPSDRANHVLVAVLFILAAVSGLALFHPSMFFLTAVLGGGELSRVLHPFVGVAAFVFFLGMFFRFWHHNLVDKNDQQWMCQMGDVLNGREEKLPESLQRRTEDVFLVDGNRAGGAAADGNHLLAAVFR